MLQTLDYLDSIVSSAKRAIQLEVTDSIFFVILKRAGERDFSLLYGFKHEPSADNLEILSLIETEIVSDIWRWVGKIKYDWVVVDAVPKTSKNEADMLIYEKSA